MTEIENDLLTRVEAADFLGVTVSYLESAARRKRSPPYFKYSGRTVRYLRADLLRWRDARLVHIT